VLAKSFRRVNVAANKSEVSTDREQLGSARNGKASVPGETVQLAWYHRWPRQGLGILARSIFAMVRLNNHRLWCLSYRSAKTYSHRGRTRPIACVSRNSREFTAIRRRFDIHSKSGPTSSNGNCAKGTPAAIMVAAFQTILGCASVCYETRNPMASNVHQKGRG
jgi:hypothetical protein